MATAISLFRATDGSLHETEAAADALNLRLANIERANAYVNSMGFGAEVTARGANTARTMRRNQILDFLVWEQTPRADAVAAEPAPEPLAELAPQMDLEEACA
jgi:hypothetical protein